MTGIALPRARTRRRRPRPPNWRWIRRQIRDDLLLIAGTFICLTAAPNIGWVMILAGAVASLHGHVRMWFAEDGTLPPLTMLKYAAFVIVNVGFGAVVALGYLIASWLG